MDTVDYKIDIPRNRPSGLYWFRPHAAAAFRWTSCYAGPGRIITIGKVGDNVRGDHDHRGGHHGWGGGWGGHGFGHGWGDNRRGDNDRDDDRRGDNDRGDHGKGDNGHDPWPEASVRHLILKETQVLAGGTIAFDSGDQAVADGEMLNQEDPDFCAQFPASTDEVRHGSCPGQNNAADEGDGNDYTGGKWYFTVNGQQYPTIPVKDPDGEIWRITNAAASLSYDLKLVDDSSQTPMVMQLVAVDGVSIHLPQDTPMGTVVALAGARFKVVRCPVDPTTELRSLPVCVTELVMMPSSRAEIWVTYRDPATGRVTTPPASGAAATFKMVGLTMGSGDLWPAVDLASVAFAPTTGARQLTSHALDIQGDAFNSLQPAGIFSAQVPNTQAAVAGSATICKALAPGHRRRIFFGFSDVKVEDSFALGYEEVDENGTPVPGTYRPPEQFNPEQPTICLPLARGQKPVHETWELVQLSTENHNFHIHQTRFRRILKSAPEHPSCRGSSTSRRAPA